MILAGENVRVIKSEHIQDKPNKKKFCEASDDFLGDKLAKSS